jgi:hypothetical protein
MSDWYIVTPACVYGMQDVRTIDGMYEAGRILPVGSIVPLEWKGRQLINDLYVPANYLESYTPTDEDMPLLYMLWPSIRPRSYTAELVDNPRVGRHGAWAHGWYEICKPDERRNMSSVPYGIAALMDIEGVCKAGDVALAGDIVPAAFFAGLSAVQVDRLETIGLCSETWLSRYPVKERPNYLRYYARAAIRRVGVTAEQKAALYERYPALNPNAVQETAKVKTTKRKA